MEKLDDVIEDNWEAIWISWDRKGPLRKWEGRGWAFQVEATKVQGPGELGGQEKPQEISKGQITKAS